MTTESVLAPEPQTAADDASYRAARRRSDLIRATIDDPEAPGRDRLRVLTGDRPTGRLHVGHYLASLRDRVALQDQDVEKMSKSRGNTIELGHSADETARRVRRARTDGERRITYEPERRPEVASLLTIAASLRGDEPGVLADAIGDSGAARLKQVVTEAINETLAGHRARRAELAADPTHLASVLHEGNQRANEVAERTLATVRTVMGMAY